MPGLLGLWSFETRGDSSIGDSSGFGHPAQFRGDGNAELRTGRNGDAIYLRGDSDIAVPSTDQLRPQSMTLSAWVNIEPGFRDFGWLIGEGDNFGLVVNRFTPGDVHFYYRSRGHWVSHTTSNIPVNDQEWHHVAATFDNDSLISKIYIDGELINTEQHYDPIAYEVGEGVHLGSMLGTRNYEGLLDEVSIFDRPLEPTAILELMD